MPHPVARPSFPNQSAAQSLTLKPVIYVVRGRPGPSDRPALPPGSPESWGAITDDTMLDRAAYPFPIYSACRA